MKLPDKPSKLILLALRDLELVEKDKRYKVKMEYWHQPIEKKCYVCLAGSVLAKSFKEPISLLSSPDYFPGLANKLWALNSFRGGYISEGLYHLNIKCESKLIKVNIIDYAVSPKQFKSDMRLIAKTFASLGL